MMKKHRASWARSAGGAAALSIVGAAGLALAAPGFAHEERLAPADVVMATQVQHPIIEKRDVERLRAKCGGPAAGQAIICSDDEVRDPEVRAIVAQTKERVQKQLAKVKIDRREMASKMAQVRKSVEEANKEHGHAMQEAERAMAEARIHASAAHGIHAMTAREARRLAHMERALAHARDHLQRMDVHRIRADAIRTAMVATRMRLPRQVLTPLHVREIEAAMEEAGRELERIEIHIDMPDLEHDHFAPPPPPAPPAPPVHPMLPEPPLAPVR